MKVFGLVIMSGVLWLLGMAAVAVYTEKWFGKGADGVGVICYFFLTGLCLYLLGS